MKTKKYWIWFIVSFSILIVLWPTHQITGETGLSAKEKKTDRILTNSEKSALYGRMVRADEKEVLQGLESINVVVAGIREVEKYGLTRKALQTDTELQLRQYGIKVITVEEVASTPEAGLLYIQVGLVALEGSPMGAASMSVELHESVLLLRKPKRICVGACTWKKGGEVTVGMYKIKEIREVVKDFVNEFINDYLAANPKDGSIKEKGSVFDDLKKTKNK